MGSRHLCGGVSESGEPFTDSFDGEPVSGGELKVAQVTVFGKE